MAWTFETSQGNESEKVRSRIATYLNGRGIDLGCGPWKIVKNSDQENNCIGVDVFSGADIIGDISNLPQFTDEQFDYVFSSHSLEDIFYTEAALREWWRLLKPDGVLILYLPLTRKVAKKLGLENWKDFYPDKGSDGANPAHKHDYHPEDIRDCIGVIGHANLEVEEIRGEGNEYSFLQVYRKLSSIHLPVTSLEKTNGHGVKKALVVRYGAYGDCLMSTGAIRLLAEQGYKVTVNCTSYGEPIFRHNPYVENLAIQQKDIVPNTQLESYWKECAKGYDRFVNLSGAAEDSLLIPDTKMFLSAIELRKKYPNHPQKEIFESIVKEYRKRIGDKNYYDNHLEKAGLEERGLNGELYFTPSEELVARDFRNRYRKSFIILWSLSGSSYHKIYPYFQWVVQDILNRIPEVLVISVGDDLCALMERAESDRYLPRSGIWNIRQSMIMTKYADLVVGPETGILNAAGCFDTPKITLLSHSTHGNLCKYWKNDYCLSPENTWCYPCHMLHYQHPCGKDTFCHACGMTHYIEDEESKNGIISCPYGELDIKKIPHVFTGNVKKKLKQQVQRVLNEPNRKELPLCMAEGIKPERVVQRILEVYESWQERVVTRTDAPVSIAFA